MKIRTIPNSRSSGSKVEGECASKRNKRSGLSLCRREELESLRKRHEHESSSRRLDLEVIRKNKIQEEELTFEISNSMIVKGVQDLSNKGENEETVKIPENSSIGKVQGVKTPNSPSKNKGEVNEGVQTPNSPSKNKGEDDEGVQTPISPSKNKDKDEEVKKLNPLIQDKHLDRVSVDISDSLVKGIITRTSFKRLTNMNLVFIT